jgi:hypothetical protein
MIILGFDPLWRSKSNNRGRPRCSFKQFRILAFFSLSGLFLIVLGTITDNVTDIDTHMLFNNSPVPDRQDSTDYPTTAAGTGIIWL